MKLTELQIKDTAKVVSLETLDKDYVQRLMDVGLYHHAKVTLLNRLSFGNLILLEVDNIELCIRKKDAEQIEVER
ncbi:MAG: ferrous iron transport protein A [Candidatus Izimaplasma sp.]|nr:ferrous iron transport protein A [Candidatus Izimaplasma bacterium]